MYINFLHHVDFFPNFIMWFIALLPVSVGYRPSASQRGERKMRKIILASILGLALLSSGCAAMMSRALMNTDSRTPQKELDFNRTITKDVLAAYESLSGKEGASIKGIVKAIDREANRAHKAGDPSVAAMLSNQLSRPIVEQGLQTGFEWTANTISQVAGGAVGGGGLIGTIVGLVRSSNRKKKALNIFKTELTPEEMARAKKAAEHTGLEREVG